MLLSWLLVGLGLAFRLRGFLFQVPAFWRDESAWAVFLVDGHFGDDSLRPLGFMAVSRAVAHFVSTRESALRALPWLFGMSTALLAPSLARRLLAQNAARVLFVAILALHPGAIDFSKEFKPYAVSLGLHTLLLLMTLRYLERPVLVHLLPALLVALVGTLFAQDLVFAYPGVFVLVGREALVGRRHRHLALVVITAAALIAVVAFEYLLVWRHIESRGWGAKYNVFYEAPSPEPYAAWLLDRLREMAEFPGYRRLLWRAPWLPAGVFEWLHRLDAFAWVTMVLAGILSISFGRRARLATALVLPLATLWLFNRLHFWPLGAFRTNLFSLLYTAGLAAAAFDRPQRAGATPWAPLIPALLVVVLPLVLLDRDFHASKRGQAHQGFMPEVLTKLAELRRRDANARTELMLVDTEACPEWEYYTVVHPDAESYGGGVRRLFSVTCRDDAMLASSVDEAARSGARVWVLLEGRVTPEWLAEQPAEDRLMLVQNVAIGSVRIAAFARSER